MLKNLLLANTLKIEFLSGDLAFLNEKWSCEEKGFPFTRLYYIYSGSAELSCKGKTIIMMPGNMYLLPTGLPIAYQSLGQMEQLFFHITLATPEGFDLLSQIDEPCQLPCSESYLAYLKDLCTAKDYGRLMQLKTCISQNIVDCLLSKPVPVPTKPYSQAVLQAMTHIQNNLTIQLTGEQIAHAVGVSLSFLNKRFKTETGISLGAYQDKLIFSRANQLLAEQQLSLKEISQQLGFCDQYYFSRRFKAKMGKTPSQYRKYHLAPPTR